VRELRSPSVGCRVAIKTWAPQGGGLRVAALHGSKTKLPRAKGVIVWRELQGVSCGRGPLSVCRRAREGRGATVRPTKLPALLVPHTMTIAMLEGDALEHVMSQLPPKYFRVFVAVCKPWRCMGQSTWARGWRGWTQVTPCVLSTLNVEQLRECFSRVTNNRVAQACIVRAISLVNPKEIPPPNVPDGTTTVAADQLISKVRQLVLLLEGGKLLEMIDNVLRRATASTTCYAVDYSLSLLATLADNRCGVASRVVESLPSGAQDAAYHGLLTLLGDGAFLRQLLDVASAALRSDAQRFMRIADALSRLLTVAARFHSRPVIINTRGMIYGPLIEAMCTIARRADVACELYLAVLPALMQLGRRARRADVRDKRTCAHIRSHVIICLADVWAHGFPSEDTFADGSALPAPFSELSDAQRAVLRANIVRLGCVRYLHEELRQPPLPPPPPEGRTSLDHNNLAVRIVSRSRACTVLARIAAASCSTEEDCRRSGRPMPEEDVLAIQPANSIPIVVETMKVHGVAEALPSQAGSGLRKQRRHALRMLVQAGGVNGARLALDCGAHEDWYRAGAGGTGRP
jgi:hypothetical protein